MSGAPQVAMRAASQIWQIFFPFANPSGFLFFFRKTFRFFVWPFAKGHNM
jgi:hypothetical protein